MSRHSIVPLRTIPLGSLPDKNILDESVPTLDQSVLTLDQSVPTLDQSVLTLDQSVLTLTFDPSTIDSSLWQQRNQHTTTDRRYKMSLRSSIDSSMKSSTPPPPRYLKNAPSRKNVTFYRMF